MGQTTLLDRSRSGQAETIRLGHQYERLTIVYYTHALEYDRTFEDAYIAKAYALMIMVGHRIRLTLEQTKACQGRDF